MIEAALIHRGLVGACCWVSRAVNNNIKPMRLSSEARKFSLIEARFSHHRLRLAEPRHIYGRHGLADFHPLICLLAKLMRLSSGARFFSTIEASFPTIASVRLNRGIHVGSLDGWKFK